MNFPDEWQDYQTNGRPSAVPGAWSSSLSNPSDQNDNSLRDRRHNQPRSMPTTTMIPEYTYPTIMPEPQSQLPDSGTVTQNGNEDQEQNQNVLEFDLYDPLEFPLPVPAPMSRWTGSAFNKSNGDLYENRVPRLMPENEIEDARNFERYRLHSIGFELCKGDVLVFIDYPTYHTDAISYADCNGITYKSQQFRVHSEKLLETKSSVFDEMLRGTYQFKIQRRRKMVNKMPEGIKYLIDLTPPSEGDDLVFQMTELSLTPALIKWWRSYIENDTDMCLVSGHDDVCKCNRRTSFEIDEDVEEDPDPEQGNTGDSGNANSGRNRVKRTRKQPPPATRVEVALQMKAQNENEFYATPAYRNIPDYCPVRHRNGIIRLLMLIEGKGAILDSAPRMWTLVKLGNIFDCSSLLRDRVHQWILHGTNTTFIEVAPEEALQMAFSLQIPEVAECAFRILVNELALKLADDGRHEYCNQTTIFGRRLGNLPDELSNTVQHAAQAYVARISDIDKMMRNNRLFDFWDIDEWSGLRIIEQLLERENSRLASDALDAIGLLMDALVAEVTEPWDHIMSNPPTYNHLTYKSIDQDRLTYMDLQDFEMASVVMQKFNRVQMALCAATYNEVGVMMDARRWNSDRCRLRNHELKTFKFLAQKATDALAIFLAHNQRLKDDPLWARTLGLKDYEYPTEVSISRFRRPIVSLNHLEAAVKDLIRPITLSWQRNFEPSLNLTRHLLLNLTDNELKYLPLWCGGCDDGTGGVFEDPIPSTDMGPKGPGPSFHTGQTIPSAPASVSGSMIEDMDALRVWGSSTGASMNVQDSISTVYRPDQVIAEDESIASESFTIGGSEYSDARFAQPADHQGMGEAIDMQVETFDQLTDSETRSVTQGRSINNNDSDGDNDLYMWDDDGDSDDSSDTIF